MSPSRGQPTHPASTRPRIAPAPAAEWLQVPRLLLTLAGLRLQRAWRGGHAETRRSRREWTANWEF